jgi:phosphomethylpyrimidine synthase
MAVADNRRTGSPFQDELITGGPLPGSRKIHVPGRIHPDVRVPMREVALSPTRTAEREVPNEPVTLYDTSGPYTDPAVRIDVRRGLPPLRLDWIRARGDVEELDGVTSAYGREREADPGLRGTRFRRNRGPLRAKPGRCVTQMHHARRGEITPEMEFVAIRETMRRDEIRERSRR